MVLRVGSVAAQRHSAVTMVGRMSVLLLQQQGIVPWRNRVTRLGGRSGNEATRICTDKSSCRRDGCEAVGHAPVA